MALDGKRVVTPLLLAPTKLIPVMSRTSKMSVSRMLSLAALMKKMSVKIPKAWVILSTGCSAAWCAAW